MHYHEISLLMGIKKNVGKATLKW